MWPGRLRTEGGLATGYGLVGLYFLLFSSIVKLSGLPAKAALVLMTYD
jgi:hypothetical protein